MSRPWHRRLLASDFFLSDAEPETLEPREASTWSDSMELPRLQHGSAIPSFISSRRHVAASFLLLEPHDVHHVQDAWLLPGSGDVHSASSFHGHGHEQSHLDEGKAVASDLTTMLTHPTKLADPTVWAKLLTDIAVLANFGALILTFLGAAYHAYGYKKLRDAQKQSERRRGGDRSASRG
eukprot:TRINITY_DN69288_c0_g1_i1.p1 TRINITY_DN69288_c0_g1~~TRINITY_DN69288_c0_g1_i1.p1  ORF type:complete len:180 (-),score=17.28 TRINITY_DN69288_c0_g1_i1:36-575(-)